VHDFSWRLSAGVSAPSLARKDGKAGLEINLLDIFLDKGFLLLRNKLFNREMFYQPRN